MLLNVLYIINNIYTPIPRFMRLINPAISPHKSKPHKLNTKINEKNSINPRKFAKKLLK